MSTVAQSAAGTTNLDKNVVASTVSSTWPEDFVAVRNLLLSSPWRQSDAVAAAVAGLEHHVKNLERDVKLRHKFAKCHETSHIAMSTNEEEDGDDTVKVEYPRLGAAESSTFHTPPLAMEINQLSDGAASVEEGVDASASEWQTVQMETIHYGDGTDQEDELSEDWARYVIDRLAVSSVTCTSPVAALAVALHARIIVSAKYVCTGVPESAPPSNGFAAPVRDVTVTHFLPAQWNTKDGNVVRLRYRHANPKSGLSSMILTVQRDTATTASPNAVTVSWEPVSPTDIETKVWAFALEDFVNLESWHVAATRSRMIAPALHYKSLATFLSTFVSTVCVWPHEPLNRTCTPIESDTGGTPYIDYTMLSGPPNNTTIPTIPRTPAQQVLLEHGHQPPRWSLADPADPLMISSNRSSDRYPTGPMQGDFSGDLRPTGLDPFPGYQGGVYHDPSILPGNLMGPNHPMFRGGGSGGGGMGPLGSGGMMGMHPRFDPLGPPGGPTQHNTDQPPLDPDGFVVPGHGPSLRRAPPPGGTGNPNNDLQRFPPSLGNNSGHNLYL
jgi:hypothetical protein